MAKLATHDGEGPRGSRGSGGRSGGLWGRVLREVRSWFARPDGPEYQRVGALGEDAAVVHVKSLGMRILARNVRLPMGEADILAREEGVPATHVVIEVKTRLRDPRAPRTSQVAPPEASITRHKQRKLRQIAMWLARSNRWERVRIDIVAIEMERVGEGYAVKDLRYYKGKT
jgi:putative endonuclease